jgi:hypothetical protein
MSFFLFFFGLFLPMSHNFIFLVRNSNDFGGDLENVE